LDLIMISWTLQLGSWLSKLWKWCNLKKENEHTQREIQVQESFWALLLSW
jgi:hypothetical protein